MDLGELAGQLIEAPLAMLLLCLVTVLVHGASLRLGDTVFNPRTPCIRSAPPGPFPEGVSSGRPGCRVAGMIGKHPRGSAAGTSTARTAARKARHQARPSGNQRGDGVEAHHSWHFLDGNGRRGIAPAIGARAAGVDSGRRRPASLEPPPHGNGVTARQHQAPASRVRIGDV